jgi:hypothetical protein
VGVRAEQEIPHRAAHPERRKAGVLQAADDFGGEKAHHLRFTIYDLNPNAEFRNPKKIRYSKSEWLG